MNSQWGYVLDVMMLSLFLGAAAVIKANAGFFRKFFVPTAIMAGFIGLLAGPQLLGLANFNADHLGNIVYHLMSVGFISLSLKERRREKNMDIVNTGVFIVGGYVMQGIIGFGLSLLMAYTLYPKLFPVFGMLLPLGYGQGAAQAYSIGKQWEPVGFANGGNIGLSMAALGLLWACFGGVPLMNYLIRVRKLLPALSIKAQTGETGEDMQPVRTVRDDAALRSNHKVAGSSECERTKAYAAGKGKASAIFSGESIDVDSLSVHVLIIGVIYLVTYLALKGITAVLMNWGPFFKTLTNLLWGFSFIIASLFALLFRLVYNKLRKNGRVQRKILANRLLERITGLSFDYMITASIAAISITILKQYLVPTLVIGTIGGISTALFVVFVSRRIYRNFVLENILAVYGNLTGIMSTGLALVKEIDPDFESSAPKNLVLGSGAGLFVGFPLMMLLNLPVYGFETHQPMMYLYTLLALCLYLAVLMVFLFRNRKTGGNP